jgi:hypothetical protein
MENSAGSHAETQQIFTSRVCLQQQLQGWTSKVPAVFIAVLVKSCMHVTMEQLTDLDAILHRQDEGMMHFVECLGQLYLKSLHGIFPT